jgi:hypothetical protein
LKAIAGGDYWSDTPESFAYLRCLAEYQYLRDDPFCWPPSLLSAEGQAILNSPAGRIEFLIALLSRTHPGWNREDFTPRELEVLLNLDDEARLALEAIAYARHPGEEIAKLANPPELEEFSWGKEIFKLMDYFHCPDFETIGGMYLSQWTLLRSGGEYVPGSMHGSDHWMEKVGTRWAESLEKILSADRENGNGHRNL